MKLYKFKAKGPQIRSRAKCVDKGEKNTSYWLRLENKHQSHHVKKKVNNNGKNYTQTEEIFEQRCLFYNDLYSSKNIPDENCLSDINHEKKITEEKKKYVNNFLR